MSVDIVATLRKPVTLAALLGETRRIASEMLDLTAAPDLVVFAERQYREGVRLGPGRRLGPAELRQTLIGERIPPTGPDGAGSIHFEIDTPATGDGVFLAVIDQQDDDPDSVQAVFSPYRTCVGVAVATFLALAAARLADGKYVDEEIRMVTPAESEPDIVLGRTRLSAGGEDFALQCEKYLRQFRHLGGWPRDRSMR